MKSIFAKMSIALMATLFVTTSFADTLKDSRDGKTYKTVKIGDKVWMAENLNVEYNRGSAKSLCYDNDPENCSKFGRLYTWAAAMDSAAVFSKAGKGCGNGEKCKPSGTIRGVCPEGWHLPSMAEWESMTKTVGESSTAGAKLKSTSGWADYRDYDAGGYREGNGKDSFGFAALPGGYLDEGEYFSSVEEYAYFWTSSEFGKNIAYNWSFYNKSDAASLLNDEKFKGFSVRCVKD